MKNQAINIKIEKLRGRSYTRQKNKQGFMLLPCPKCGSRDIVLWDCGYTTFNPGGAECNACNYHVNTTHVDHMRDMVPIWNDHCKNRAPDYVGDLNAMNRIENELTSQEYRRFIECLVSILEPGEFAVRAPAPKRAKAYLIMKARW